MAEQFAFQKCFGNRGAIDFHQRAIGAQTPRVYHVRQNFLAHAALAADQHACLGRSDQRGIVKNGLHQRAARDDIIRQFFLVVVDRRGGL